MVVIRLARRGSKRRPFYDVVVADSRSPRDGRHIEEIGFHNPLAKGGEEAVRLSVERYDDWVSKGAQPSDSVKDIYKKVKALAKAA